MAPDFTLPDQTGAMHSLADYHGRWLVLYFYPKDDTPGCTIEACSFRDSLTELTARGAAVIGISKDSVKSHKKFANKFSLTFPLLSDQSTEIIKAYGAWGTKKFMGREFEGIQRNTYLINPEGEIVKTYEKVNPKEHTKEILADIERLH